MLAYYLYPFAPEQELKEYTKQDLMNPKKVEELFDYCQILEGYITRRGWEFLIAYYGYKRLLEIDKRSGWLSERTDYTCGDLYEAEEVFLDGRRFEPNRLIFVHYPDGKVFEPINVRDYPSGNLIEKISGTVMSVPNEENWILR